MTFSTRTVLLAIAVTATVTSTATLLIAKSDRAEASSSLTYRLRLNDYVEIPALDWTCSYSLQAGDGPLFVCDTNDKPISHVIIRPGTIQIAARSKQCPNVGAGNQTCGEPTTALPTKASDGSWVFRYHHG